MELFTNTNQRKDILRFELEKWGKNREILIASAFFDNKKIIKHFVDNNCIIKMIIRLDHGTNANSLKDIINLPNVFIRYFTGRRYHPKFYLFKNGQAFVGSSNLTDAGLMSNNEANISIPIDSPIYEELEKQFNLYWVNARVLDNAILDKYIQTNENTQNELDLLKNKIDSQIKHDFGLIEVSDTNYSSEKVDKKELYIEDFKRSYQIFLTNFEFLRETYKSINTRKIAENELPLRIEIDQFFNWIRDKKCHKTDYETAPILSGDLLKDNIISNAKEFIKADMIYFNKVVNDSYPSIVKYLSTPAKIDNLTEDELKVSLYKLHSFHDQLRFFPGGFDNQFQTFIEDNTIEKIKKSFKYILFSTEHDFRTRIGNYYYDDNLRLKNFGESCAKELFGWLNDEDIPIFNNRTYYSMRWLGFGNW